MDVKLSLITEMKLAATIPIVKGLFGALPHLSENFVISIIKRLYGKNNYPEGQKFIEKALITMKHVFKTANPNCKRGLINSMLINEGIRGQQMRNNVTRTLGFDIPALIVVSPTQRCPLKCYGCYSAEHARDEDLRFDAFDRVIGEAKELGIYFFVFSGGEPFIYDRIFDIFGKHGDAYFQIYTSGVTIAERDDADRLSELGNVLPCISLEGFEDETDRRRGKGHFKRIRKAMRKLRERGVPFGFSATATSENTETLLSDKFVDFYVAEGCSIGYFFQYMPVGRSPVFDLVPTPQQRMYRFERVNELRSSKNILLADFWCDGPLVGGCLAGGRRYIHINNSGDAEPCVFAHASDMNIYEHTLPDILRNSRLFRAIRKRQPYSDNLLRPCMIIDVPDCWRDAIRESNANLSYTTADNVARDLRNRIDGLSEKYAELADPVWDEKYKKAYEEKVAYVHEMRKKFDTGLTTK